MGKLKTIPKWIGLSLGVLITGIWLINSDFVNIIVPVRTMFPILLIVAGLLASVRRDKTSYSAAVVFSVLGVFIFISGRMGYSEETISFQNSGTTLEGSLYVPEGGGPFPLVVIAHGSPCMPRRVYHTFADHLARNGVAVFSFDKRGTGNSGGHCVTENNTSLENLTLLASDLSAGLEKASLHPLVDPGRLGIWGISQGGWIAPLAAKFNPKVAFIALVSGPSVSTGEENYYSALTGDGHEVADNQLTQADIEALVDAREPSGFDPYLTLENLSIPILWVFGGADSSVPVTKSIKRLEALQELGKSYEIALYPNSSHILVEMVFPFRFSEGFQDQVAGWIKAQPRKTQ